MGVKNIANITAVNAVLKVIKRHLKLRIIQNKMISEKIKEILIVSSPLLHLISSTTLLPKYLSDGSGQKFN